MSKQHTSWWHLSISALSQISGPILTKNFGLNFLGGLIFVQKFFFGPNLFSPKCFLDPKMFWTCLFIKPIFLGQKYMNSIWSWNFWDLNVFGPKFLTTFFRTYIFWIQIFFDSKYIGTLNLSWHQFFSRHNKVVPPFFLLALKLFFDQTYFLTQIFLTWIYLNPKFFCAQNLFLDPKCCLR